MTDHITQDDLAGMTPPEIVDAVNLLLDSEARLRDRDAFAALWKAAAKRARGQEISLLSGLMALQGERNGVVLELEKLREREAALVKGIRIALNYIEGTPELWGNPAGDAVSTQLKRLAQQLPNEP